MNQRRFSSGESDSRRWRTIMAYRWQCEAEDVRCPSLLRFANPGQIWNGDALGVPGDRPSHRVDGPADAVRLLNHSRHAVAGFRDAPRNRAPQPDGRLGDRTLDAREVAVELGGAFWDPDGDGLTYGAMSSAPAVAAAVVSGSRLRLTPVGPGAATVMVSATDVDGSNTPATQSFTVTVVAPFTDHPIVPGETPVRAVHFTELRSRIDGLRTRAGLAAYRWTDPVLTAGTTPVRLEHLLELRSALDGAYGAAGRATPSWTDEAPAPVAAAIRAVHLMELRAAAVALE